MCEMEDAHIFVRKLDTKIEVTFIIASIIWLDAYTHN